MLSGVPLVLIFLILRSVLFPQQECIVFSKMYRNLPSGLRKKIGVLYLKFLAPKYLSIGARQATPFCLQVVSYLLCEVFKD